MFGSIRCLAGSRFWIRAYDLRIPSFTLTLIYIPPMFYYEFLPTSKGINYALGNCTVWVPFSLDDVEAVGCIMLNVIYCVLLKACSTHFS